MVIIEPQIATKNPAPAFILIYLIGKVKPVGAPSSDASWLNEY